MSANNVNANMEKEYEYESEDEIPCSQKRLYNIAQDDTYLESVFDKYLELLIPDLPDKNHEKMLNKNANTFYVWKKTVNTSGIKRTTQKG